MKHYSKFKKKEYTYMALVFSLLKNKKNCSK